MLLIRTDDTTREGALTGYRATSGQRTLRTFSAKRPPGQMFTGTFIAAKPSRRTNRAPSNTSYSAVRSDSYVFAAVEARVLNKSRD